MKQFNYHSRFTTPAFLGNAEQNGQWRTPPFKALLRQWWRVAYAADQGFHVNLAQMRREEGLLFGHAWLDDDHDNRGHAVAARKSLVRMRLDKWTEGQETKSKWGQQDSFSQKVHHPEVGTIGPLLYLGYGPLDAQKVVKPGSGKPEYLTVLKRNAAIQAGEFAQLSIAVPTTHKDAEFKRLLETNIPRIKRALWLMDRYGTLGGRSRNGWGSFALLPCPSGRGAGSEGTTLAGTTPFRPWCDAFNLDWPHAIGQDEQGALIWQTSPFADWKQLMRELAIIKIGLRTQFLFTTGFNAPQPEARHWLSHPVTRHNVGAWRQARLPNSLRFKARFALNNQFVGVIFHVPCLPPQELHPNQNIIMATWRLVHGLLDELTRQPSARRYGSIADARRTQLKPQLDTVTLKRIPE